MLLAGTVAASIPAAGGGSFTPGVEAFEITEGSNSGNFGFGDGVGGTLTLGSIDPTTTSGPFTVHHASMTGLGLTFTLIISGSHVTDDITSVEFIGDETVTTAGNMFLGGEATYNGANDYTQWIFQLSGLYWDGAGTENINITFP